MDKYYLSGEELYHILKEKGIKNLYHANTVLTSKTFIEQGSLLSRAYVEDNYLFQTPQDSDKEDKSYNVWDDIFVDALDLHDKYKRPNKYGPVLFVLRLELLLSPLFKNVLITKDNPWYWKPSSETSDRYYSNLTDVKEEYLTDVKEEYLTGKKLDLRVMFTFRSPKNSLNLNDFLEFIGIDKPDIIINLESGGKNVGEYAYEAIEKALKSNNLQHIPIHYRHQSSSYTCNCKYRYNLLYYFQHSEFRKRFKANI